MKNFEFNDSLFEACGLKPFDEEELSLIMGGGDEPLTGPADRSGCLSFFLDDSDESFE